MRSDIKNRNAHILNPTMVLLCLINITLISVNAQFLITPSAFLGRYHKQLLDDAVFFVSQPSGNNSGFNWTNITCSYFLVKSAYGFHAVRHAKFNYWHVCVGCTTELSLECLNWIRTYIGRWGEYAITWIWIWNNIFPKRKRIAQRSQKPILCSYNDIAQTSKDISANI